MSEWNKFGEPPNKNYDKFFKSLKEIDSLPIEHWKTKHFIGYFCKKYYYTYNKVFKLSCNTIAPSKSREMHEITRVKYMLSSDPKIIKEYFDWAFKTQLVKRKRRITSLRFLTTDIAINEYKSSVLWAVDKNIQRTTPLTSNIKEIIELFSEHLNKFGEIKTFGHLAFVYQCKDQDPNVNKLFEKISDMGFDLNVLNEVV